MEVPYLADGHSAIRQTQLIREPGTSVRIEQLLTDHTVAVHCFVTMARDFSAHTDRPGLLGFLEPYREREILLNHGDRCGAFATELREDGYGASAPVLGERRSV